MRQAAGGNASAWGVEDLPSNQYGLDFEPSISGTNSELPDALEKYINEELGGIGTPPKDEIDKMNLIRNFTQQPVMSPDDPDILVDKNTTIPYKAVLKTPFVQKQLQIMSRMGISGKNVGGNKMGSDSTP